MESKTVAVRVDSHTVVIINCAGCKLFDCKKCKEKAFSEFKRKREIYLEHEKMWLEPFINK